MSNVRICGGTRLNGEACAARAQPESPWCLFHDPGNQDALREGRATGGRVTGVNMDFGPEYFVKYARRCMKEVRDGKLSPQQGSAIASLGNMALKAQAQMETDKRVDELDERTKALRNLSPELLLKFIEANTSTGDA